ncbi:hypothetical protein MRX96_049137 [Rhipicephalus microplus]
MGLLRAAAAAVAPSCLSNPPATASGVRLRAAILNWLRISWRTPNRRRISDSATPLVSSSGRLRSVVFRPPDISRDHSTCSSACECSVIGAPREACYPDNQDEQGIGAMRGGDRWR